MSHRLAAAALMLALAAPARAADRDPWLGRDKALHFTACFTIAGLGYLVASLATERRPVRIATALGLSLAAGLAKEGWDALGHGDASVRDLTWDAAGAVMGTAAGVGLDLLLSNRAPDIAWTPPGMMGWARLDPRVPVPAR